MNKKFLDPKDFLNNYLYLSECKNFFNMEDSYLLCTFNEKPIVANKKEKTISLYSEDKKLITKFQLDHSLKLLPNNHLSRH